MSGRKLKQGKLSFSTSRRTGSSASGSKTEKAHKPQRKQSQQLQQQEPDVVLIDVDEKEDKAEDVNSQAAEDISSPDSALVPVPPETPEESPHRRATRASTRAATSTRRKVSLEDPTPRKRQRKGKDDLVVDATPLPAAEVIPGEATEQRDEKLERWRKHYGWVRAQMGHLPPGESQ